MFSGRACPLKAKPATVRCSTADQRPDCRDGVGGGSTRRQRIKITGETLPGLEAYATPASREAYKGNRNRRNEARQGVGGGHSTDSARELVSRRTDNLCDLATLRLCVLLSCRGPAGGWFRCLDHAGVWTTKQRRGAKAAKREDREEGVADLVSFGFRAGLVAWCIRDPNAVTAIADWNPVFEAPATSDSAPGRREGRAHRIDWQCFATLRRCGSALCLPVIELS